jgi:trigger factor
MIAERRAGALLTRPETDIRRRTAFWERSRGCGGSKDAAFFVRLSTGFSTGITTVNMEPDSDKAEAANENDDVTPEETEAQDQAETQESPESDSAAVEESPHGSSEEDSEEASREDSDEEDSDEEDDSLGTVAEVETLGPCKLRVTARVEAEKVDTRLDKAYDDLIQTVSLPGFRRGRVPRRLLEKRYGEEVDKDIKEQMLAESFAEVVEEKELRLLGAPDYEKVEFSAGKDLTYETDVQVHPEFDLPKYKGIEVEREVVPVDEDAVDKELESLRRDRTNMVPIAVGDAGDEDQFVGVFKLFDGDVEVKESDQVAFSPKTGRLEHFSIEGLSELVKGWGRAAAGTSDARPLVADVTVPESYPEEVLRGKDLRLEFTLAETRTPEVPELDEEFAKGLGCESVEDLRKTIQERVEKDAKTRENRLIEKSIIERLLEEADLDLPKDLIDRQRKLAEEQIEQKQLASGNDDEAPSEEEAADDSGKAATLREEAGEKAAEELSRELKEFFLLERIGEKETIVATEDEVKQRVQMMAMVYGVPPATMITQLRESGRLDEIRMNLRNEKVKAFLRKKAKISSPAGTDSSDSTDPNSDSQDSQDGPEVTEREEEASHS